MIDDHPFIVAAKDFLSRQYCIFAPDTITELNSRYRRQAKHFDHLLEIKKVSTNDPYCLGVEDIKEFFIYLQEERKLSRSGIKHEITALNSLCKYCDNNAVERCKKKYPKVASKYEGGYLPTFSDAEYNAILAGAEKYSVHHYMMLRAYAMVILSLGGGLRRKEVKYAKLQNLNLEDQTLLLERVKGDGKYGSVRMVALRPTIIPILKRYLDSLALNDFCPSDYIFANKITGMPLSDSAIDKLRETVSDDLGFRVTFMDCRRSYGQTAVDDGLDIDYLSVIMGHASVVTTQKFYARTKPVRAVKAAKQVFNEKCLEKRESV